MCPGIADSNWSKKDRLKVLGFYNCQSEKLKKRSKEEASRETNGKNAYFSEK